MVTEKQLLIFVYIITVFTGALYGIIKGLPVTIVPHKAGIILDDKMAERICKPLCNGSGEAWSGKALKSSDPRKPSYCICLRRVSAPTPSMPRK